VLFISVLLVDILVSDGKSHWLEGAQLSEFFAPVAVRGGAGVAPLSLMRFCEDVR
jgi:hypothetical protein